MSDLPLPTPPPTACRSLATTTNDIARPPLPVRCVNMSLDTPEPIVHPLYSDPDADFILKSKDATHFRVHSIILRVTSGFFRALFSLPQKERTCPKEDILYVDESSSIIAHLLSVITGKGLERSAFATYQDTADLLHAAEKYEMPGVIATIRLGVTCTHSPFHDEPLQLYALSRRYGWREEEQLASERSLSVDITSAAVADTLPKLDAEGLVTLLKLRWERQNQLKCLIKLEPTASYKSHCSTCSTLFAGRSNEWRLFVLEEFTRLPSGQTLLEDKFLNSPEVARIFSPFHCKSGYGCGSVCVDREGTLMNVRRSLADLPKSL